MQVFDGYLIEDLLNKKDINRSVYVLGENGETPLEMVTKLDSLIASRPGVVVIGVTYYFLTPSSMSMYDYFVRRNEGNPISYEYRFLFNDTQLKLFDIKSPYENFFNKRKYLFSSIYGHIRSIFIFKKGEKSTQGNNESPTIRSGYIESYASNFKDPWGKIINETEAEKAKALNKELKSDPQMYTIFEDSNQQKNALQYTIKKLRQNNISVIIINMPISPNVSNVVSESTRINFSKYLNSTEVLWYDYEWGYPSEYFIDKWHMNVAGRNDFSPRIATVLVDYFRKGS
jgi:hypothetical protein